MNRTTVSVLIADSHDLFRQGLSCLLQQQPNIEVVGEACDIIQASNMAADLKPNVLLIEPDMQGGNGLSAALQIMANYPQTTVAIWTSSKDDNYVRAAVELGIKGYLLKSISLDELVQAIFALSQGEAYFSSKVCAKVLRQFSSLARRSEAQSAGGVAMLTDREKDVLRVVARGATNREIAEELVITENTVKVHLRNILGKLQLYNRQQAAAYAVQEGLITCMPLGTSAHSYYGMRVAVG